MKKHAIILALMFGQIYIWTGAIFMTILYHLFSFYDEVTVTYITEVFYYIMQAAGIFFYAMFIRFNSPVARKKSMIAILLILTVLTGALSMLSADAIVVLIFGAIMNLFIGCLTSAFLTRITTEVTVNNRGMTFGLTYAAGSVGTYLISLPSGGNALTSDYIIYVYIAMAAISVACTAYLKDSAPETDADAGIRDADADTSGKTQFPFDRYLLIIFMLPIFFMLINTMGYHFEQANAGHINIVFTRAFYALGLLTAGFINDKSRKTGAVCALLALGFPLISLALRNDPGFILISSVMSYIFLGFLSVYRAVLFADLAENKPGHTFLSTFGIAGGLIGNAIGTTCGLMLESRQTLLACMTLMLYIVCGFLFFIAYNYLYASSGHQLVESGEEREKRIFEAYVTKYHFNAKQTEVLRLLLSGCSNCEIAENLYLSESTVKYHVKNILKATGQTNRNDLIEAYKQAQTSE